MTATKVRSHQVEHLAPGAVTPRALDARLDDALYVTDFGALGDGVADDSAAIQACIAAAQADRRTVCFPDGVYRIPTLNAMGGRVSLRGFGNSVLKGTFVYGQSSFPPSADTNTPTEPGSVRFDAEGLAFEGEGPSPALQLLTQEAPGTASAFSLTNCRFFGARGLWARYMGGFEIQRCEFNNVVSGARFDSCSNGLVVQSRFQNCAESGVWIAPDGAATYRAGGEGLRFVLCEWLVCTYGLSAVQHRGLTLADCLFDRCALPLYLSGSDLTKASMTRFLASNAPVARFSGVPGYVAPPAVGACVWGRPDGTPFGSASIGFTAHGCEFVGAVSGATQALVNIGGYASATYPNAAADLGFVDCLFLASTTHSATTMVNITSAQLVTMFACRFNSPNRSTSLTSAYSATGCLQLRCHTNDFQKCTQSNVIVTSPQEKLLTGVYVQAGDPGAVGAGSFWVTP